MASLTETLAAFVAGLRFADLPSAVVREAERHFLDTLGVALASSTLPFGRAAVEAVGSVSEPGPCSVIGSGRRLPAVWAALVNGTLAHGLDYDDTHLESVVHVSAGIVPAALAAAEDARADGPSFLAALVAGTETSVRIGIAARGGFHDRGFHPTGICNAFGAAVAAGVIAGQPAARIAAALGIAGSQAAGLLEFLTDGSDVKRIHPGWAAHSGLVASRFAAHGFSGPREVLEGRLGLYRSHLGPDGWSAAAVTADLGARWHCTETGLKPYPCCHYLHAFLDAAARLRARPGVAAGRIARIHCHVPAREVPIICEPQATKKEPQTDYDAKFSLPYAIASMLVRGHVDIDDFAAAAIRDPAVLALAARVSYAPESTTRFPERFGGSVRIELDSGEVFEEAEPVNRGSAERPLADADVVDKFRRNAGRALPEALIDEIVAAVFALETQPSLERLTAALRGGHAASVRQAG